MGGDCAPPEAPAAKRQVEAIPGLSPLGNLDFQSNEPLVVDESASIVSGKFHDGKAKTLKELGVRSALGVIGEGTYGRIYKGTMKGKAIAVKQYLKGFHITSFREAVIMRYFTALRRSERPGPDAHWPLAECLKVARPNDENEEICVVMPFCPYDLYGLIKSGDAAQLNLAAIKSIMRDIVDGVDIMHRFKHLHRDLKSSNILINAKGRAIITDFGMTRRLPLNHPSTPQQIKTHENNKDGTGDARRMGRKPLSPKPSTRWYIAPELLLKDQYYSLPSDIFAMAAVFIDLIAGKAPFVLEKHHDKDSADYQYLTQQLQTLGVPTAKDWPRGVQLVADLNREKKGTWAAPSADTCLSISVHEALDRLIRRRFSSEYSAYPESCKALVNVLTHMMALNPAKRYRTGQLLRHPFFNDSLLPRASPPTNLPDKSVLDKSVARLTGGQGSFVLYGNLFKQLQEDKDRDRQRRGPKEAYRSRSHGAPIRRPHHHK
ncbi:hypothetical protein KIPB_000022 [Kipferlia bialata]|uniref:Protein kinase domain-containing protein n=1 Tax=Kipferlia bialata TaxID=797122 RepID=A0A9K3GD53_9EUKA|nr:hypothetical protein KIPB_000022 [Kipferlia bialata]|eukprot:g22.t1